MPLRAIKEVSGSVERSYVYSSLQNVHWELFEFLLASEMDPKHLRECGK